MNYIKITVVTVVYNDFQNIESTINSVITQTYPNIEYIIIDGGSSDGTLEIINKYKSKIDIVISERDNGIYDAMNKGTLNSTGNWICYMNSGDVFSNSNVISNIFSPSKYVEFLNIGVIYSDVITDFNSLKVLRKAKSLKYFYRGICFSHQSLFVNTFLAKKYQFNTKYSISADYDFLYNLYNLNIEFKYVNIPIAKVDISKGISKEVNLFKLYKDFFEINRKYTKWPFILLLCFIVPFEYLYAMLFRIKKHFT